MSMYACVCMCVHVGNDVCLRRAAACGGRQSPCGGAAAGAAECRTTTTNTMTLLNTFTI